MWVTVVIYSSVIGWAYLLGSLLGLMQDKGFQAALVAARFARAVRRLREPFYLLCGLGETGQMVARALDRMGHRFVALDPDEARVVQLDLGDFATDPPALAGDVDLARDPGAGRPRQARVHRRAGADPGRPRQRRGRGRRPAAAPGDADDRARAHRPRRWR